MFLGRGHHRPTNDYVALSVDGSFSQESGAAAAGMILRRHDGSVVFAAYRFIFNCNDALKAEIHAIIQGMALAIQYCGLPVIVQPDSTGALSCLSGDGLVRSAYGHLVAEIKELMRERVFISQELTKDQNRVADRLANYSRIECTIAVWMHLGPGAEARYLTRCHWHRVKYVFPLYILQYFGLDTGYFWTWTPASPAIHKPGSAAHLR